MTTARLTLKSLFASAALACAFVVAAAPAEAQQRRSILERYENFEALEGRLQGFQQHGDFHTTDIELCRDGGQTWWVATYDDLPRPHLTAGFDAFIQPSNQTDFLAQVAQLESQGWFIDDMDASAVGALGAVTRFVAVLNEQPGSRQAIINANTWESFQAAWHAQQAAGMRIVDLDVSTIFSQTRYHAVMRPGDVDERIIREPNLNSFHSVRQHMEGNGWRVRDIAMQAGVYMAVLNPGSGPTSTATYEDWPSLMQAWAGIDARQRWNMRIKDVECWLENGQTRYAALYRGTRSTRVGGSDRDTQERDPGRLSN